MSPEIKGDGRHKPFEDYLEETTDPAEKLTPSRATTMDFQPSRATTVHDSGKKGCDHKRSVMLKGPYMQIREEKGGGDHNGRRDGAQAKTETSSKSPTGKLERGTHRYKLQRI